jgi:hypothetical protein
MVSPASTDMTLNIVPPTKIRSRVVIIMAFNIFVVVVTHVRTEIKPGINHVVIEIFNTSHERINVFFPFIVHGAAAMYSGDKQDTCELFQIYEGIAEDRAFAAYDSIAFCSGKIFTDKELKEMLRRSILGSEDSGYISLPEQMMLGITQFAQPPSV